MKNLEGKRILVTGAASGIGEATVRRLTAEGAKVFLGDVNTEGVKKVAEELGAPWAYFDLVSNESITSMIEKVQSELGGLDGVANVAADVSNATMEKDTDVVETEAATWQHVLNANLIGTSRILKLVVPMLLEAGGGAVVNVSSDSAVAAEPIRVAYGAAKSGVEALSRHVATRWGKENIRCNTVSPGVVLTPAAIEVGDEEFLTSIRNINRLPELGQPDDLAATICFLLSDDGKWVTGQTWSVNGGFQLRR